MLALNVTPSNLFVPPNSLSQSALDWFERDYDIIPIIPGSKSPAVTWAGWLAGLSKQAITACWQKNPTYALGLIVGDNIVVLDADSPESVAALDKIEEAHCIKPNLIIETTKGVHHYFKRAAGTIAKSDSHCTKLHPARIDVKTGRAMVILPPSTGKSIALNLANNANNLTEVGQDFIYAVARHNSKNVQPSSTCLSSTVVRQSANSESGYLGLKALLSHIDADCGYDDWFRVLMGIFHYMRGSDDGFEIANAWSSKSGKYHGENEIRAKWNSFNLHHPRPVTLGTIISMVKNGHEIYHEADNQFEVVSNVAVGAAK